MDKKVLYDCVDKNADLLRQLSDRIWEYAELSLLEYKSMELYCKVLEENGFRGAAMDCIIAACQRNKELGKQ